MQEKTVDFKILRFKPGVIDPPRFQTYRLAVAEPMTVLDCLTRIQTSLDPTLMFRHSCHHSSCGTCAMRVNGTERLACITRVWSLNASEVTLAPLAGFPPIGDLAVDMAPFYRDIDDTWSHLRPAEKEGSGADRTYEGLMRFENCIECGCCVSVCPVPGGVDAFVGPAALAAVHREMTKSPDRKDKLLKQADGPRGQRRCQRALACSRVCPTGVYPAKHIIDLRNRLKNSV